MEYLMILNLTISSYYICNNISDCNKILRQLLEPLTEDKALVKDDVGESHWKKDDKIVYVPPYLYEYVQKKYGRIYLD